MARLENLTAFGAAYFPSMSFDDRQLAVVVVGARFSLPSPGTYAETLEISDEQDSPPLADVYWGSPGESSLRYEGQAAPLRPGTDVYLNGRAWAPGAVPTSKSEVSLTLGSLHKRALVFGDRHWTMGVRATPSTPRPFVSVPLVYERCFGGPTSLANPVGQGLYASEREALGKPLPNIERPDLPISSLSDVPPHAGFGPIARHWSPRREYGGTYDDAWVESRAPLWPRDVDPRLMCGAPPSAVVQPHLVGGEQVQIHGVCPGGALCFPLPRLRLQTKFEFRRRVIRQGMTLDGVLFEIEEGWVTLYWRSAIVVDPDPFALHNIVLRELRSWESTP